MPTIQQDRIAEALARINKEFAKALAGKIEDELTANAQKVWEGKAFPQTVRNAIVQNGNNWFRHLANKRYVLRHVRLIARIARFFRARAGNARVSERQLKKTIELVIRQAQFDCPVNLPGQSCAGYQGIGGLDV